MRIKYPIFRMIFALIARIAEAAKEFWTLSIVWLFMFGDDGGLSDGTWIRRDFPDSAKRFGERIALHCDSDERRVGLPVACDENWRLSTIKSARDRLLIGGVE